MGLVQSGTARWWQTRSKMPPFHPPTLHPSSQQTWIKGLLCSEAPGLDVGVEVIRKNTYSLTSENSKSRRGARESLTGYEAPPPPPPLPRNCKRNEDTCPMPLSPLLADSRTRTPGSYRLLGQRSFTAPPEPPRPVCRDHVPTKGHITEETFLGSVMVNVYNANLATLRGPDDWPASI